MCDCYHHKCEKCDTYLSMHISDFCLPRHRVKVYCNEHIPDNNVVVFTSLGGIVVPIDTPRNRTLLEMIGAIRERRRQLREQRKELNAPDKESWDKKLWMLDRESELLRKLEQKLLIPEESHLMLPGYYCDSERLWESVAEDLEVFPKGCRIGVQFLGAPPRGYSLEDSVTPNLGVEYEVKIIGNPVIETV